MEGAIKANVSVRRGIKAKAAMRKFALMTVRIMEYAKGINANVRKISMELTALLNYVPITVVKEENVMSIVDNANVMTIFTQKAAKKLNVNQIVMTTEIAMT